MMLASLFRMWGREAFHLTQLFTEPVYFVSGLNFPVARLGLLGALAIATIPLAVGLDAMRQLAFVGAEFPVGTPSPEVEALILVVMTVVFVLAARWTLRVLERRARQEGRLSVRWQ
jgi:ABC-2 type transport system permease protein